MKLSELITLAQKAFKEEGDLEVCFRDRMNWTWLAGVKGVDTINTKAHCRHFIPHKYLGKKGGHGGGSMFTAEYQKQIESQETIRVFYLEGNF